MSQITHGHHVTPPFHVPSPRGGWIAKVSVRRRTSVFLLQLMSRRYSTAANKLYCLKSFTVNSHRSYPPRQSGFLGWHEKMESRPSTKCPLDIKHPRQIDSLTECLSKRQECIGHIVPPYGRDKGEISSISRIDRWPTRQLNILLGIF